MVLKKLSESWIMNALLAAFCFAGCTIFFKFLVSSGVSSSVTVGGLFGVAALMLLPVMIFKKDTPLKYPGRLIAFMIFLGIASYIGNVLQVKSITSAPNPGFPPAVIGAQSIIVALISWRFLGLELNKVKLAGIVACALGVMLISIQ